MRKLPLFFFFALAMATIVKAQKTEKAAFSEAEMQIILHADSIQLYRIKQDDKLMVPTARPSSDIDNQRYSESSFFRDPAMAYLNEYKKALTIKERQKLLRFLLKADSGSTVVTNTCTFQPGAGIRFYRDTQQFTMLLCFNCNIWAYNRTYSDTITKMVTQKVKKRKTKTVPVTTIEIRNQFYYIQFDVADRKELIKFAKQLFPKDEAFKQLK